MSMKSFRYSPRVWATPRLFVGLLLACRLAVLPAGAQPAESAPDLWFPVGETLDYRLYWGVIYVGHLHVATEWVEEEGKRLLSIKARARSNAFLDKIWRLDDYAESIVDPETFLPVRFIKRTSEGGRKSDEVTLFDRKKLMAHWEATKQKGHQEPRHKTRDYPIDPDTRDVLSHLYWARKFHLKAGETKSFRVMTGKEIYDLYVKAEKEEELQTPYFGRVNTLKFAPEAALEKVFVRKGKLWFWVSNDDRWIIVSAKARVTEPLPVKTRAVLWKVGGPPTGDRWVPGLEEGGYEDMDQPVGM